MEKYHNTIIVNADDFGYDHNVNMAIVDSFTRGLITNTTVMVNMPGYEEAVCLAKEYGFMDRVGLHLNLYEGKPLTHQMNKCNILVEDGVMTSRKIFHNSSGLKKIFLSKDEKLGIISETSAQIEKFLKSGFTQRHLDSHGHAHTIPSIWLSIEKIVKTYGFISVRQSLNLYSINRSPIIKLYKNMFNRYLTIYGFITTDHFTSSDEFLASLNNLGSKSCEVMVHPAFIDGILVNRGGCTLEELSKKTNSYSLDSFCCFEKNMNRKC